MLAGDYQTYLNLSIERSMEPHCHIGLQYVSSGNLPQDEDLVHLLTKCRGTYDTRSRIMPQLLNLVSQHFPSSSLLDSPTLEEVAQFLLCALWPQQLVWVSNFSIRFDQLVSVISTCFEQRKFLPSCLATALVKSDAELAILFQTSGWGHTATEIN